MGFAKQLVFGFEGKRPSSDFCRFIECAQPAGIILFERNLEDLCALKTTIAELKGLSPGTLFMIDEEGGAKSRLRREHGFPNPPDPRIVAETMHPSEAREAYRIAGEALCGLGIDVDLAPLADIAPKDHILGARVFSDKADTCCEYITAVVEGLTAGGVRACAKHFPGLGSAAIDPHLALSFAREEEDFSRHFAPFRAAVEAGVHYIMTTHLVAKQLDSSGECATYSSKIVDLIRSDLGFKGEVISDDLFMTGASESISIAERAMRCIGAGHDLALICKEFPNRLELLEQIDLRL